MKLPTTLLATTVALATAGLASAQGDTCAAGTVVINGTGPFPFDTTTATTTAFGGSSTCAGADTIHQDVYFTVVFPTSGTFTFDTYSAAFDTRIAVYGGPDCAAGCLAYNDNAGGTLQSAVTLPVLAGDELLVQIGGVQAQFGAGSLRIEPAAPLVFAGLEHTPLGLAHLQVTGGKLVVDNLGSSGCDGVSIAAGGADGLTVESDGPLLPAGAPIGSTVRLESTLQSGLRSSMTTTRIAGGGRVTMDYTGYGTNTRRIQAYCGEQLVADVTHSGPWDMDVIAAGVDKCTYGTNGNDGNTGVWMCVPDL